MRTSHIANKAIAILMVVSLLMSLLAVIGFASEGEEVTVEEPAADGAPPEIPGGGGPGEGQEPPDGMGGGDSASYADGTLTINLFPELLEGPPSVSVTIDSAPYTGSVVTVSGDGPDVGEMEHPAIQVSGLSLTDGDHAIVVMLDSEEAASFTLTIASGEGTVTFGGGPGGESQGEGGEGGESQGEGDEGGENQGEGGSTVKKPGGGSSSSATWVGANTITSSTTSSGATYSSTTWEQNALLVTGGTSTITNPTITKTNANGSKTLSSSESYDWYGVNAAVCVKDSGKLTISGGSVVTGTDQKTSNAQYASGVFVYGKGQASLSGTTINTYSSNSGGIMIAGGGGTLTAENCTVTTYGGSSAAIRSDKGGGTITVNGGTYTSNGRGSPAVYSTADISVNGATLVSNLSEGAVIEGSNSITFTNCDFTANNTGLNGNATFYNAVFLYQSGSGDADGVKSVFTMNGGSLTNQKGHVFHVTNASGTINLSGVAIVNNDAENVLLSVCDDGWTNKSHSVKLNASNQELTGKILVGSDASADISLTNGSKFTGTTSGSIKNHKSNAVVSTSLGTVKVTLDSTSKWYLTEDTYITSFDGTAANVITNGYKLYVNGTELSGTTSSDPLNVNGDNTVDVLDAAYALKRNTAEYRLIAAQVLQDLVKTN